jgi:hypothetical protein
MRASLGDALQDRVGTLHGRRNQARSMADLVEKALDADKAGRS